MNIKKEYNKIVKRWNKIMLDLCLEHITINTNLSELESDKAYYRIQNGIDIEWLIKEASYWLSCYYEIGNIRNDTKIEDYNLWKSETEKLKRLIAFLKKHDNDYITF